jgi:hypothetical protein
VVSADPKVFTDPLHGLEDEVHRLEDEVCPPPEVEDKCLTPEVLLRIAYEVVSQLDQAEEFRLLPLKECSLRDFLEEKISAL